MGLASQARCAPIALQCQCSMCFHRLIQVRLIDWSVACAQALNAVMVKKPRRAFQKAYMKTLSAASTGNFNCNGDMGARDLHALPTVLRPVGQMTLKSSLGGRPSGINRAQATAKSRLTETLGTTFEMLGEMTGGVTFTSTQCSAEGGYGNFKNVCTLDPKATDVQLLVGSALSSTRLSRFARQPVKECSDVDPLELVVFANSLGMDCTSRVLGVVARESCDQTVGIGNKILPGMQEPLLADEKLLLIETRDHGVDQSLAGQVKMGVDLYFSMNRTSPYNAKFNVTTARQIDGPGTFPNAHHSSESFRSTSSVQQSEDRSSTVCGPFP
jgi:hypothetical protein